jgi:Zn-dependent peptidase ImmA (M78 family)
MIVHFDELCRNEIELEKLLSKTREVIIKREATNLTAEQLSLRVRAHLNLGEKPIYDIRKLLLRTGIHVFSLPIEDKKLSGISWWHHEYGPCILVNYYDEPRGRRTFTMAHELAHLIKGGLPTVCDLEFDEPEEKFANSFASYFLIPANDLREEFKIVVGPTYTLPDYKQLGILANRYRVSLEALSIRLENLDLIEKGSTEKYINEWSAKPRPIRGAKGPRWKRQLGDHYVSLALNAYSRGSISVGKLAQYLGVDARTAFETTQKSPESP